jgi:hypothetical protein
MISEALQLKPATVAVGGTVFTVTRPSVLDMIDALEQSKRAPDQMLAWLVWRHTRDGSGPMFATLEEVLACDVHAVSRLGQGIQALYEEGRD